MIMREDIFDYVRKKYNIEADHPLPTAPDHAVMRHPDNRKWFAVILEVPKNKLGMKGTEKTDIINVKTGDPLLADLLTQQQGFFRGWQMNRGNWIAIILDGTVPQEEICHWIDESFAVTASRQYKEQNRPAKEWLIPANPAYYDIVHAFDETDEIIWKQGKGVRQDDTVFIYAAAPVSAILYECTVLKTDIPYNYAADRLTIHAVMRVKLKKKYDPKYFTFEKLKKEYGIFAVRGPRGIPASLSKALHQSGALSMSSYPVVDDTIPEY